MARGRPGDKPWPTIADGLSLVDDDASATERGRGIGIVGRAALVVVDDHAGGVPDLDSEFVDAGAIQIAVHGRDQEVVARNAIDGPDPLVLGLCPADREPRIRGGDERETTRLELELRVAGWHVCALGVLRNESECRLSTCRLASI